MFPILFLALWMASGLIAALVLTRPGESAASSIPMGIILGPLWVSVGVERRTIDRR